MLRVLVNGDPIWVASGYSKVVKDICFGLKESGHRVAHVPIGRSLKGGKFNFNNILCLPSGLDVWNDVISVDHYNDWQADLLITVKDVWLFNYFNKYALNWCPIVAVEHSPVSIEITARLNTCFRTIAVTRFGQKELRSQDVENVEYIPHNVPTDIFRPLNKTSECRKLWQIDENAFVVGIVAANRVRKMIPRMLRGYKRFLELNPDVKSHLFLWTNVKPRQYIDDMTIGVSDVGQNLLPELMDLGLGSAAIWPDEKLVTMGIQDWAGDNYIGGWDMVKLYNTFNVLFLCSGGEGFGLPLIEAQSCGVPVITTDYAGGAELCGSGYTVKASDYVLLNTPGSRYALADIDGMANALTKIYNADRAKLAKKARAFAERYDRTYVWETYWAPALEKWESELKPLITKGGMSTW